jgi:hypothetical protein
VNDSNGTNGPVPPEPDDTPQWTPTPEQPWRPLPDEGADYPYVYDYGADWCADRLDHPHFQDSGYPSINHHPSECRSYGGYFDGWYQADGGTLDGPPGTLSAYLVRPFQFGQLVRTVDETRLAVEFVPRDDNGDGHPFRCTLPASLIRNLAAHLVQTAGVSDGWRPPRHVKESMTD